MPDVDIKTVEKIVEYSRYLGTDLISVKELREKQDAKLANKIIDQSVSTLEGSGMDEVEGTSFFVGSVDFMVHRSENGEKRFAVIETNGGSSRGLVALHKKGWKLLYDGFLETLKFTREDPLVLIGHSDDDRLLQEKFLLTESFKQMAGLEVLSSGREKESGIILDSYGEILPKLGLDGNTPLYQGNAVDIMVGDGIVRRKESLERKGMRGELDTVLVNEIFPETDDKALTYEAVKLAAEKLKKFRVHPLDYWSVSDKEELIDTCRKRVGKGEEVIVKPYGGSGGNGVNIILNENEIEEKVENSLDEFYSKFGRKRRAFPYTVCEKVNFSPIEWKGTKRNFDIRIYVARKGNRLVPCGGLARVALEPYTKDQRKESFVVNLSGYEGVDVNRGVGISKSALEKLELTERDFVDMFSASVILFKSIIENHEKVIESFLGERIMKE